MTTLQRFIDEKFVQKFGSKEKVKIIDIDTFFATKIFKRMNEIEGGELDLSDYSNLENIKINSDVLKSSLTKLILGNNPKLRTLTILNSSDLTSLDISSCSELRGIIINGKTLVEIVMEMEVIGWENTQLLDPSLHNLLKQDIEKELKQTVEVAPKSNKCNIL